MLSRQEAVAEACDAILLEKIMTMFRSGTSDIDLAETLEIIRFYGSS